MAHPSCFPSYYPLQKAINEKGFTFNLERFHLHTLSRYFSQAGGGHKIRLQKLGMYWEPSATCSNYISSAIECKKAAEANKPFDANNGYWGDHRPNFNISNLYHNSYYRPPGCFQFGGNGQYEFNKQFLSNVRCSSWYKCICAPSPNCSNSSLPYKKVSSSYYWSKIFGQYNKDWYGNDQEHILKAHRFLNGWPG